LGGDLATGMAETQVYMNTNPSADVQSIADSIIGAYPASFNYSDMCIDADALGLSYVINAIEMSERYPLSNAIETYYNSIGNRYDRYIEDLGCIKTLTSIRNAIYSKMTGV
jgi:hypothetical protein